jgi:hypothetical protein
MANSPRATLSAPATAQQAQYALDGHEKCMKVDSRSWDASMPGLAARGDGVRHEYSTAHPKNIAEGGALRQAAPVPDEASLNHF